MGIDVPTTRLVDVPQTDAQWWQFPVFCGALLLVGVPVWWWRHSRADVWRWWKSGLFLLGVLGVLAPIAVVGGEQLLGDSHAEMAAVDVVAQLLAAHPVPIDPPSTVVVEVGEHSSGSAVHVPTKGDGIYYDLRFRTETAGGEPVVCRPLLYLQRSNSPRGDPSPLTGRLVGECEGE